MRELLGCSTITSVPKSPPVGSGSPEPAGGSYSLCPYTGLTTMQNLMARDVRDGLRRWILFGVGTLSLVAGLVGVFLPIWPTTCFLLLSAACYSKSSERAHRWMYGNRWFGRYLTSYRDEKTVPRGLMRGSLLLLWSSIGISMVVLMGLWWVQLLLLGIAGAVTWHLASLGVGNADAVVPVSGAHAGSP